MAGLRRDNARDGHLQRRSALAAVATALAGVAGCFAEPAETDASDADSSGDRSKAELEERENATEVNREDEHETDEEESDESENGADESWPAFGFDAANTGSGPDLTGPTTSGVSWIFDGGTPTMNCSPIVSDGVVYTAATGGDGGLYAIDGGSGEHRWEFETAGYASSAPGFDGKRLYVGTWDHRFHAVDADTGDEIWTLQPGHRFGDSSPAVVDGVVYVGSYGDAPMVVSGPDDEDEFEAPAIFALEAETGEERWRYDAFDDRESVSSSPAVADGLVFVVSPDGELLALEADSGDERWRRDLRAHSDVSPTVIDSVVYCPGRPDDDEMRENDEVRGKLWALETGTGETRWSADLSELSLRTSPAVDDGVVYLAGSTVEACPGLAEDCEAESSGTLYAIDAESGEGRWEADLAADTRSSPAVADGTVYVGNGTAMSAIGGDGEPRFEVDFREHESDDDEVRYLNSSPAVADGRVYVGTSDGRLYAIGDAT
ncbi:PQQ-binding-like beta-propeller repeat protein [Natrarchaeobius sp. A-rgal3]|uniref:outer membrane protein assembly factor BamB family protein n=1 Tax=Natrarchaeobius versutus TaxID=1679078 RepID=UPI00350ECA7E